MTLRIRRAETTDDRLAGLAVRHAAYRRTMPLAAYQAARLASGTERSAAAWIAEDDGRVVATLLQYPLEFVARGARVLGHGIGSVGTLPEHARRGHATALCRAACDAADADGRRVGLLFASVAPAFYERLAFAVAPAAAFRCERLRDLADGGPCAELVPVDPVREADRLAALHETALAGALHVARDAASIARSAAAAPDAWWFEVRSDRGGYVRVERDDASLDVVEAALVDPADEAPVLRAAARLAVELGAPALDGWTEPPAALRAACPAAPRDRTLPMVRGAAPAPSRFHPSDHF